MGKIADDQTNIDYLAYFDILTPALQLALEAGGMIYVYGTAAEMKLLERHGIGCHAGMVEPHSGMYLWLVTRKGYQKAKKRGLL